MYVRGFTVRHLRMLIVSLDIDIHRLGRTARAGMTGNGLLILAPYERFFLQLKAMRELSVESWSDDASGMPVW